jgi:PTH1 family peptidyl-tRNA hydrolase
MSTPFKALVGLGNPGRKYEDTRHNAGFWLLDRIAALRSVSFRKESRFLGEVAELGLGRTRVRLLKPTTYMNESGRSVGALIRYFGIDPEEVLVAHDEIDLPPGTTRLKVGGGHGGHNGLRDVINRIASRDFARVRIGVGHPGTKEQVIGYVLSRAQPLERRAIDDSLEPLLASLDDVLGGRMETAMNALHRRA